MEYYEPPVSLWEVIKANTGVVELDELRSILGPADVDISLDLRLEVESLLEIWRDMREEKRTPSSLSLVENSETRKRLVSDIKFFIDSIKENPDFIGAMRLENITSRPVVKLALAEYDRSVGFRCHSSLGSDGRSETPSFLASSRSTPSRNSMNPVSYEDLVQMKDKFKVNRVLEVAQHLRQYLSDEIVQLKEDVNYLRNSIDEENALICQGSERASLSDLKTERNEVAAEIRWATENAALLRPSPCKRHGSLDPLPIDSSRPSSVSSVASTICPPQYDAQAPASPDSFEKTTFVGTKMPVKMQCDTCSITPAPPQSETRRNNNIRVVSPGNKAPLDSMRHHSVQLSSSNAKPSVNVDNCFSLGAAPIKISLPKHSAVITSRPPLPPSSVRKSKNSLMSTSTPSTKKF